MSKSQQSEINSLGFASTTRELEKNFKQVEEIMANFAKSYEHMDLDPFNLMKSSAEWYAAVAKDPQNAINANLSFLQKSMELYQHSLTSLLGGGVAAEPVIIEDKGDRRFKHEGWEEQPAFNAIKQSYLLVSKWLRDQVQGVEGLDEHTAEKVEFFTERYLDAMSPTNFAATNPAVIEKVIETKGANLVHGLKNMLEDLEAGKGELRIRMTDTSAFELGGNVATTPGKVVFQNRMFQLIQYTPATDSALKRPLLVIPPWINKYYVMDLQPKNSLLKWLVDQGHTVFVVSWVNPDSSYAETSFADYVTEGVIAAVDAVEQATGESEINMIGYCIGGTLLATTLAYMQAKGDQRVKSATFLTTMLDFASPGELGVFIDEEQICGLEKKMNESGYLDGTQMAGTFNLMRANDLIWSFYINNYLLGNDPRPFDLLYWNSDSTRMPARMHAWYLRNLYLENNLCKPGGVTINGVPIDISKVDIPVCFVSTVEDHIAPWKSTCSGARLFSGDVRFMLGGSGHIAGIINPPAAGKYNYRVTDRLPADVETWAAEAEVVEGSWWPEWDRWVKALADDQVAARQPGDNGMPIIEEAPGSYVKRTLNDISQTVAPTADERNAAAAPAPEPVVAASSQPAPADDLTAIKGIGPKLANVLTNSGIVSYAQLAEMGSDSIKQHLVSVDERYARYDTTNWPEQARMLMP
ncbi:class I poly(R)-hydroxyalkanoic acid synthase [Sedimenticola hydrogenitrophicus]|uniref:class I poly(R)-hydroxyalkanoic acid synthase n=1 Tax=Sedimenticola hydrogenitrophicus TaxID=2967975 RepID=UPI0023B17CAE|nr:class I poly(R)-hydroxyalkanoic acid synthase [Sedimenticola hydrogenitrophicus]